MAANVVWRGELAIDNVCGSSGMTLYAPESRTSMIASLVVGVLAESRAARVSRLMGWSVAIEIDDIVWARDNMGFKARLASICVRKRPEEREGASYVC